jgi:hypothetical protein
VLPATDGLPSEGWCVTECATTDPARCELRDAVSDRSETEPGVVGRRSWLAMCLKSASGSARWRGDERIAPARSEESPSRAALNASRLWRWSSGRGSARQKPYRRGSVDLEQEVDGHADGHIRVVARPRLRLRDEPFCQLDEVLDAFEAARDGVQRLLIPVQRCSGRRRPQNAKKQTARSCRVQRPSVPRVCRVCPLSSVPFAHYRRR